jgi:asparagine synthase (glutamine-hydrolysing)
VPSALDIATGTMVGCARRVSPLPVGDVTPRAALEREILPALLRPPCLVSFSGGRDSSAVLAVAVALARREGLELPIPATNVFPAAVHASEAEWQELVVRHVGAAEWLRPEHDDEMDVLGPYARRMMRRHGLLLPCNAHFHLPLIDAARGGSLLTGVGGDELFTAAGCRPAPRNLARAALAGSPAWVRRLALRYRHPVSLPWLRPRARGALTTAAVDVAAREPRELFQRVAWWRGMRHLGEGQVALTLAAADGDVLLSHPLLGARVWSAAARVAAPHGFEGRTDGMRRLFGDLLPEPVLSRASKAHFNEVFWTATARSFAAAWDGGGVPEQYVDPGELYRHWNGPDPMAQSFMLAQAAWLARGANHLEERVDAALV